MKRKREDDKNEVWKGKKREREMERGQLKKKKMGGRKTEKSFVEANGWA